MSLTKLTYFFCVLVVAFTPLDALEITQGSNVTLGRYFFILMAASALFSGSLRLKRTIPIFNILVCFIVWAFFTSLWSVDIEVTLGRIAYLLQYAIIFVVMVNVLNSPRRLSVAMIGWILGTSYIAYMSAMDFSANADMTDGLYRVSEFGNPNENSFMLCYALVFCFLIDKTKMRLLSILFAAFAAFTIIANGSRMGVIMFVASMLAFCVELWQAKKRWYVLALIPAFIFMGAYEFNHIPTATLMRILGITSDIEEGNTAHRNEIWRAALVMIQYNPLYALIGCGWGAFQIAIKHYYGVAIGAHNFYLDLLTTTGVVGLSIVLRYLWKLFLLIKKTFKSNVMNYMMLLLPMISMMSTNWQSRRWWFMMGAFIYLIYITKNFTKDGTSVRTSR